MDGRDQSVGVVIRTRDRPMFVPRALRAVQAQSYRNWHVVLVNDGGDRTTLDRAIAPDEDDPILPAAKLTTLHLDPGQGRAAAFNRGLEALETEFVTCLDDDDTWAPEFLSSLVGFWADTAPLVPGLGGVAAQVTAIAEELVPTANGVQIRCLGEEPLTRAFRRPEFFVSPVAYACYRQDLYPVQWMLLREAVASVGGFPESFDVMEDRAFMNRFLARWRLAMLDRPMAFHHRRSARRDDRGRSDLLNTLDNPSYDWRLFADLARPSAEPGPVPDPHASQAATVRAVAVELLTELNYETSAIWQKIDGELASLRAHLTGQADSRRATLPDIAADAVVLDLWAEIGTRQIAHSVTPGTPFAGRFELSRGFDQEGTLLYLSGSEQRFELQLPETRDWAAVECALDGLVPEGSGLRCHVQLWSAEGYLFETALSQRPRSAQGDGGHRLVERHVHFCAPGSGCTVTRSFDAAMLASGNAPKLSIILPRQARNFRFCCMGFVLERV